MIELKQIENKYFLNGKEGNFSNFNLDGKYKQRSYIMYFDNDIKKWVTKWTFYGNL